MLFMAGILGRLFREFAVTICTAILISGMVSITLTPCCAAASCARPRTRSTAFFYRAMERLFNGMLHVYAREPALGAAASPGDAGDVLRGAAASPATCT